MFEHEDLIKAKRGDSKAFDRLMLPLIEPLHKTMYVLTGDRGVAEDIVQETMYQTFIHIGKFDPTKASLSTWMRKIAFHHATKVRRKEVRDDMYEENQYASPAKEHVDEDDEIYQEILQLTEPLKMVIVLHYYDELSIKEIAETLGINEGTVKSRLSNAREKLKQRLEQKKERDV